jgi:hypothetical protein
VFLVAGVAFVVVVLRQALVNVIVGLGALYQSSLSMLILLLVLVLMESFFKMLEVWHAHPQTHSNKG